jgi:large subunit ribosomal protein L6
MSRVGRKPIPIPKGVELKVSGRTVAVKGPKGELSREIREGLVVKLEDGLAHIEQTLPGKMAGALHGLTRALIQNMVEGVSQGFTKSLEIHGSSIRSPRAFRSPWIKTASC